jgi:glycine/D-amino acid oxidase-like deaminating enzyme
MSPSHVDYEFGKRSARVGFGTVPYWHLSAPKRGLRRPLEAGARFDIVIIGGGFTGLWTAKHLLERAAPISVAVLEANDVASGASGRNAGILTNWMGHSPGSLINFGGDFAPAIHQAAVQSVRDVISIIRDRNLECDLDEVSLLYVSSNSAGDRRIRRDIEASQAMGSDIYKELSGEDLRSRINNPRLSSGYEDTVSATENPAKLVRALADDLVGRGLTLFERTQATRVSVGPKKITIMTQDGPLFADRVVLARNAWSATAPPFKRRLLPFYVYDLITEPLTDEQWATLGWVGREPVNDRRFFLINYRRTPDNRLMFGGVDGRQPFGAQIHPRLDRSVQIFKAQREALGHVFPSLSDVRISFGHGGPIAMTPTLFPQVGLLEDGRIGYSHGYCGHGVAQSHFCTAILVDLLLGEDSERSHFPFVNTLGRRYPREPLRWIGGQATRAEGLWYDRAGDEGRPTSEEPKLLRVVNKVLS